MVHYKLFYFGIRGYGEPIRLILAYANQPFENVIITLESWNSQKPKMPFEKVPVLEVDGKEKLFDEIFLPAIKKYLPIYVKTLKKSGSGYIINCGLTWVDFLIAGFITTLRNLHPEQLESFPELENYRQRVYSLPSIENYILVPVWNNAEQKRNDKALHNNAGRGV
uniref:glutathione transferase n=1 Tax=Ditylenchus dipsaci TaxID=166011 RepID=A0A915CWW0_9BILA